MSKPQIQVEYIEMEDPTFEAGVSKVARARLTNPTARQFTYTVELYLGITKAATSGTASVTIPANSSMDIDFPLVMPDLEGNYPVFLDILYTSQLLKHYQATENVVIVISPDVVVGPIIWV